MLMLVGWFLASGRAGETLRPLAVSLAVATAVPFLTRPLEASWSPFLVAIGGLVTVLAMVPLAMALIERIDQPEERRLVTLVVTHLHRIGAAVIAIAVATHGRVDRRGRSPAGRWSGRSR